MAEQAEESPKRKTGRSPGFPALDLKSALEKAAALFKEENGHEANFATIVKHLGFSPKSGPGRMAFAALKKYGLIEQVGDGPARTARVSDAAKRIILDKRPDSAERQRALQEAALRPAIHRKLWQKYGGTLPSDANLEYQLRMDGFTESGARDFIAQFRKTLAFAGVDASTSITGALADEDAEQDDEGEEAMSTTETPVAPRVPQPRVEKPAAPPAAPPPGGPHVRFTLAGDNILEVSLRSRVSKSEFAKIKAIIDLAEGSFVDPEAGQ